MTNNYTLPKMKCLIIDDEPLARFHLKDMADQIEFLEVTATCATALKQILKCRKTRLILFFWILICLI
jgi:DNA-binding LytR/AlgR family response regulator